MQPRAQKEIYMKILIVLLLTRSHSVEVPDAPRRNGTFTPGPVT